MDVYFQIHFSGIFLLLFETTVSLSFLVQISVKAGVFGTMLKLRVGFDTPHSVECESYPVLERVTVHNKSLGCHYK